MSDLPTPARSSLTSLLFVVWCFVVGTLLLYAPWMPVWVRWTSPFTQPLLHDLLLHPSVRGAVSGFGLVHLVWGTHDLDLLLSRVLRRRLERLEDPPPGPGPPRDGDRGR